MYQTGGYIYAHITQDYLIQQHLFCDSVVHIYVTSTNYVHHKGAKFVLHPIPLCFNDVLNLNSKINLWQRHVCWKFLQYTPF